MRLRKTETGLAFAGSKAQARYEAAAVKGIRHSRIEWLLQQLHGG